MQQSAQRGRPGGFTLIELLVVITIIGILAAIALPNYIKAKDKAKEVQTKSAVKSIQVAIERYHTDFEEYPLHLLGGDNEGWKHWHARYDEANPDRNIPQNAWVSDILIEYNYLDSYPQNPFVDNGISVISQTGPLTPPAGGYVAGQGDPRFGFQGTIMGNGLEYPMIFVNWYEDEQLNIETARTLYTTTNGQAAAKGFGAPTSSDGAYQGDASNPQGLHYTFGGRRSRTNANTIGTVYTHWPGNFFYRGFPERLMARKGWTIWFPQAFVKDSTTRYMLGGYGSFTTEGQDIVRLESRDPFDQQVYYQLPPPWSTGNRLFQCEYGNGDWTEGGLPELAGGGTDTQGPWLPPDRSTDYPNAFIYGSPDGHKDAIIIVLTGGDEVQAY